MRYEITLCCGLCWDRSSPPRRIKSVVEVLEKCAFKHTEKARELCLVYVQIIVHETPPSTFCAAKKDIVQYHLQTHCHGNSISPSVVKTIILVHDDDEARVMMVSGKYWSEWTLKWMEQREQKEPRWRWRPKCQGEPRHRGDNLICLWRTAENKQRPVKLSLGRSSFTVYIEVCQLLRIKKWNTSSTGSERHQRPQDTSFAIW